MKIIYLYLVLLPLMAFALNDVSYSSFTCEVSSMKTAEFQVCECHERQVFLEFFISRPVNDWKVDLKFFMKRGNKFFEVFKSPPIDWCKIVGGQGRVFPFQKLLLKSLQKSAPKLIHSCPYQGHYEAFNISAPKDVIQILPIGSFKMHVNVYDEIDSNIATFVLKPEVFKI